MSMLQGLDELCPYCHAKPIGEHTLREWDTHAGVHTDLPYEPTGGRTPFLTGERDGEQVALADTITARALLMSAPGPLVAALPCLLIDFEQGDPLGPPQRLARIGLVGPPEMMRKFGRLLRDTANGAANAAERVQGRR